MPRLGARLRLGHRLVRRGRRLQERVRAVEVHRLTTERIVEVLRVGRRLRLALRLLEVGEVVVVGVIALVLLEGEVVVVDTEEVVEVVGDLHRVRLLVVGEPREVGELVLNALVGELVAAAHEHLDRRLARPVVAPRN